MRMKFRATRLVRAGAMTIVALPYVSATGTAQAQTVVRNTPLHAFVRYGLDATLVRFDRIESIAHIDARPYVREHRAAAGADAYLLVHITVRNPGVIAENVPLLQATITTDDGRTIDPSVYGPFLGSATVSAPTSATISPHASVRLILAIADVPDGHRVASIVFNPNDATPAYRLRLRAADVENVGPK